MKKFVINLLQIVDLKNLDKRVKNLISFDTSIFELRENKSNIINNKFLLSNEEFEILKKLDSIIYARFFPDHLKLFNLTNSNIIVEKIHVYYDDENSNKICKLFIKKNCLFDSLDLNYDLVSDKNNLRFNKIFFNKDLKNSKWIKIFAQVQGKKFEYLAHLENEKYSEENLLKYKNNNNKYLKTLKNKTYFLDGKLEIDTPIVLPKNYNLIIQSGSELIFNENAYIYINGGNIIIDGEKEKVKLTAKNNIWGGIYVSQSTEKSVINNVEIENTGHFKHQGIYLTGGINFYKSDVEIINSKISGNLSEDALNIIHSSFKIHNTIIEDTQSDAFDSDFSNGMITNSSFKNIGGDAIDTSGSKINIEEVNITNTDDKGISAGEKSIINLKDVFVDSCMYGIVSKDLSKIRGKKIKIIKSKNFDLMAFEKKNHYGPGYIEVTDVTYNNKVISQLNSFIKINNKSTPLSSNGVEKIVIPIFLAKLKISLCHSKGVSAFLYKS